MRRRERHRCFTTDSNTQNSINTTIIVNFRQPREAAAPLRSGAVMCRRTENGGQAVTSARGVNGSATDSSRARTVERQAAISRNVVDSKAMNI